MRWYWQTIVLALSWLEFPWLAKAFAIAPMPYPSAEDTLQSTISPVPTPISTKLAPVLPELEIVSTAFPSFNSPVLDQQLYRYRRHLQTVGVPDVLIVGSSRAVQGVDPIALQTAFAARGYPNLRIFNFGINGATAQVVDRLVQTILPPDHLPPLIIWADGLRAFNSGRPDRTHDLILNSPGYQAVLAGQYPTRWQSVNSLKRAEKQTWEDCRDGAMAQWTKSSLVAPPFCQMAVVSPALGGQSKLMAGFIPLEDLGFSVVNNQFNPNTYYQSHPRIHGQFDGDYRNFSLAGRQAIATQSLIHFTQSRQITLVFVNLPLTRDYLDDFRLEREGMFRQHLIHLAATTSLQFLDLGQVALDHPDYFADPSHLNRHGAAFVANQLAQSQHIIWHPFIPGHPNDTIDNP